MTTDHDPRELRSAAEWAKARDWGQLVLVPHNVNMLADYILATVRDDDGEEQEDVRIDVSQMTCVAVDREGVWVGDHYGLSHLIRDGRPTRGQFRALCRGLGIVPDAAKTV